jgi:hypothetical protein
LKNYLIYRSRKENNKGEKWRDEPVQDSIHMYMDMSQGNLDRYLKQAKMFLFSQKRRTGT